MKDGRFNPGQAYVAFSRVKTLEGLHILNFNEKAIKKSNDVLKKMVRLNANILPSVPDIVCDPACLTIALLNVRSILHQVPDITSDKTLSSANILCFCETWLSGSQCSPVLRPDQMHIRCDRVTCENKGGVMMYVPSQMQPSDIHRFATSGIEAVSCILLLPNLTHMQIALLYRSPSVSRTTLIAMLTRLLQHVSVSNVPCLILGDFK